jgi:hypothetical protein
MAFNAVATVLWCAARAGALLLPAGIPVWALAGYLVVATLINGAGALIGGPPTIALAESMAPADARGHYLSFFQYSYTAAQIVAPAITALFAAGPWVPWLVVGVAATAAVPALKAIAARLPARAVDPRRVVEPESVTTLAHRRVRRHRSNSLELA